MCVILDIGAAIFELRVGLSLDVVICHKFVQLEPPGSRIVPAIFGCVGDVN